MGENVEFGGKGECEIELNKIPQQILLVHVYSVNIQLFSTLRKESTLEILLLKPNMVSEL